MKLFLCQTLPFTSFWWHFLTMSSDCSTSSLSCFRTRRTLTSCKLHYKLQDFSLSRGEFLLLFLLVFVGFLWGFLVFFRICIKDLTCHKIFLLSRILFSFPIWVSLSLTYSVGFWFVLLLHGAFFVLLSHFSSLKALILCIYLFLMKAEILMLPNEYWS